MLALDYSTSRLTLFGVKSERLDYLWEHIRVKTDLFLVLEPEIDLSVCLVEAFQTFGPLNELNIILSSPRL